jgi:hypothetical protein
LKCEQTSLSFGRAARHSRYVLLSLEAYFDPTIEELIDQQTGYVHSRRVYAWEPQPTRTHVLLPGDSEYTLDLPEGFPETTGPNREHRAVKMGDRNLGVQRRGLKAALGPAYGDFECGIAGIEELDVKAKL